MELERTGINEPAIALDILEKEGLNNIYQWSDPPGASNDWHIHSQPEVCWIMFGEMEVESETGIASLTAGDILKLEGGERHRTLVGNSGVGYICATGNLPMGEAARKKG